MKGNPLWSDKTSPNFGKIAVEYAAGEDVVLDEQFVQFECLVNQAHQIMLLKCDLLPKKQVIKICKSLEKIKKLDKQGKFELKKELEDVHSNVEQFVMKECGIEVGGNLRLGIARNDQIYTDTRMFLREKLLKIIEQLLVLIESLLNTSLENLETIMPGYTHLRISQPITYAHWLVAKCYHFLDDIENLKHDFEQVNLCPLGIFEMAGTHLEIDRQMTSDLLGFDGILINSLYASNTRGELEAKIIADFSILAMHLKRTMNEVIIWSTHEFGFMTIDDLYTTGGTAQPNLKNPDTLEVIRANCSKLYGKFIETISIMDSLGSGFNRDTQQTKPTILESSKLIEEMIPVFEGIMHSLILDKPRMEEVANLNFANAPDMSVQIAQKGKVSFREAYKIVKYAISEKIIKNSFTELTPGMVLTVSKKILGKSVVVSEEDLAKVCDAKSCVISHTSEGGPAPSEVKKMIGDLHKKVEKNKQIVMRKNKAINNSIKNLEGSIKKLIAS